MYMDKNDGLYKCKICNKEYKSYKSLWNHNKIKHNNNVENVEKMLKNVENKNESENKLLCKYCNKKFKSQSNKCQHENNHCKLNKTNIKMKILEKKINELKIKINNSNNKIINNNKNQINNGTIINNNIKVSFGYENIDDLSKNDQLKILNSGYMSLINLIDKLHLNPELPQYNNILVTNLKDKYCKIYDDEINKYKTINKKEMIDNIITLRTNNLKEIYNKYNNKNNKMHQFVLLLIDKLRSITPDDEELMKYYKDLYEEIILLIYNKTEMYEKNIII